MGPSSEVTLLCIPVSSLWPLHMTIVPLGIIASLLAKVLAETLSLSVFFSSPNYPVCTSFPLHGPHCLQHSCLPGSTRMAYWALFIAFNCFPGSKSQCLPHSSKKHDQILYKSLLLAPISVLVTFLFLCWNTIPRQHIKGRVDFGLLFQMDKDLWWQRGPLAAVAGS